MQRRGPGPATPHIAAPYSPALSTPPPILYIPVYYLYTLHTYIRPIHPAYPPRPRRRAAPPPSPPRRPARPPPAPTPRWHCRPAPPQRQRSICEMKLPVPACLHACLSASQLSLPVPLHRSVSIPTRCSVSAATPCPTHPPRYPAGPASLERTAGGRSPLYKGRGRREGAPLPFQWRARDRVYGTAHTRP